MDVLAIEKEINNEIEKTVEVFTEHLKKIQVGIIDGDIFANIGVQEKGKKVFLRNVAIISVDDDVVAIKPNNPASLKEIEKGINNFKKDIPLKFSLVAEKNQILLKFDLTLTQEIRNIYVNICNKKCEEFRVSLRNLRQDGFKKIKSLIKNEEEFKRNTKKLQDNFDKANRKIDDMEKIKIKTILS
jgi:ribosome recycling factor